MKKFLCFMALAVTTTNLYAWGVDGHKIIAQIAEEKLDPEAKRQLHILLDGQSLASVAAWADTIKANPSWAHTKPWHFADVPDGEDYHDEGPHTEGNIVTAISEMVKILKDPNANLEDQKNAAKFVIHFVGDIHQPLHVGRPDDHGGNTLNVIFNGKKMTLHSLWDTAMITLQKMDYLSYARSLQGHSFISAPYDIPEFPFSTVIQEDMKSRQSIYNFKAQGSEAIKLDKSYMDANLQTMNSRLLAGGERLAHLLNSIYK